MQAAGHPECQKTWWGQSYVGSVICPLDENRFNVSIKNWSRSALCNVLLWQLCKQKKFTVTNFGNFFFEDWSRLKISPWDLAIFTTKRRAMNERVVLAFIFLPFLRFRQGAKRKRGLHLGGYFQSDTYNSLLSICIKNHWPVHFYLWFEQLWFPKHIF